MADLKSTVEDALRAMNAGDSGRAHQILITAAEGLAVEEQWIREDAGLPRNWRGDPKWNYYAVTPTAAEKKLEAELPLWLREMLRVLRQEVDVCRRALEHRNGRLRELKGRLRTLQRMLRVTLSDGKGPLSQFKGATITSIRHTEQAVVMSVAMAPGSYHPDRDLEVYTLSSALHVRIDGMYVPKDEL